MTAFIVVTTKEVSTMDGIPHLVAIPVDRISTIESCMFEIPRDMDHVDTLAGCCITVSSTDNHFQEINSRDPFDHVMERLRIANAFVVDTTPGMF